MEYVIRFAAGGAIVSVFAIIGDLLRPKSFAGLFGAAPSVALATLSLAFLKEGSTYVATQAEAMVIGALAFTVYAFAVCQMMYRVRIPAWAAASCGTVLWGVVALGTQRLIGV